MVDTPAEYLWSSYSWNATGKESELVTVHPATLLWGSRITSNGRMLSRELFRSSLEPEQVHDIRATVQTGTPLCHERFRQEVEKTLKCRVGLARHGKPSKQDKGTGPL